MSGRRLRAATLGLGILASLSAAVPSLPASAGEAGGHAGHAVAPQPAQMEADWGVELISVRLSAAGTMIDLRVRVTDAERATRYLDRALQPRLIDAASNRVLTVPSAGKVGSLRQTGRHLRNGQVLSDLFANPGRMVKAGGSVSFTLGGLRLDGLRVEG
ncbi:MAG TPA: hypothetical protein VD995_16445 [Azospirillum sp.]|nr:hypothetical protein [Azospirillum sp.]